MKKNIKKIKKIKPVKCSECGEVYKPVSTYADAMCANCGCHQERL